MTTDLLRAATIAIAAVLLSLLNAHAVSAADVNLTPREKKNLEDALTRIEAQIPLTSRDHTALKKAAMARDVASLRVCGDPGNLPLSDIHRAGYQNKIIELLAEEMDTKVTYFWRPYLDRGITRQTFESGDCDVLLDLPTDFERVLVTEPVYRTTYVIAYRNDRGWRIKDLDDPRLKQLKIGTYQTSGLRAAFKKRGIQSNISLHVLSHNSDLNPENQPYKQVEKVVAGDLDLAGVWGPFAGWLKKKGAPLVVAPVNLWEDEIPLEFELAIGLRKIDWVLKYKFDLALEERKDDIEKILRDYGVPLVQCSRCTVAGDLPSHGVYNNLYEHEKGVSNPIAEDQKVTEARVEEWLKTGADLNQELSNAVLAGDIKRVNWLLNKGADIDSRDAQGYTPLQTAARNRREEVISALLEKSASVNSADADGYVALHYAVLRNHGPSVTALAKGGADLDRRTPTGYTPLALAIIEDKFKAAIALIKSGAPLETAVGDAGLTPLMLAAGKESRVMTMQAGVTRVHKYNPRDPGHLEVAHALVEGGASVNAVSKSGVTALLLAAAHNNTPIVGLLAEAGADRSVKTSDGLTAADLARRSGNTAVVSLLTLLGQAGSN